MTRQFKNLRMPAASAVALVLLAGVAPAQSTKDHILELKRDVALLSSALSESDRSTGERIVALEALLKQNLEAVNRLNQAVAVIERSVNKQGDQIIAPVTTTAAKVDALSSQFGGLRDAVEESNSMVTRLQREVDDIKNALTTLPPPGACAPGELGASGDPLVDDGLFTQAVSDFNRGNYDLAKAQFTDFLQYSASSGRAPEAQYFLGAIAYNMGNFQDAVSQFDLVLERYPTGVISADAQFKKGMSLARLGQNEAAALEFQKVLDQFPNSSVAPNAEGMLEQVRGGAKPSPLR